MQNLLYNISQVLGITIIHSLWQGLIVFIALRLFMLIFAARPSAVKYWVGYGSLVFMLGWFVVTLFKELGHYEWLSTTALKLPPLALPTVMQRVNAPVNKLYFTISGYMPYLTMLYVVGLVFNTLRLTFAWNNIYRIRQNISDAGFAQTVKRLSSTLKIKQTVKAAFSEWVDVPCVTGFIKPIILLPVAITCYLSTEEIEAILLHELAHIKRNDYLLNFIQQVIGILLFFNPFARLISKIINEERENCCDDMVVRVTGSPFIYAQALLKLEENKQNQWQLALAATTKKYELLNRIERIMKTKTQTVNIRPVLITLLALTFSVSSIAWLNPEIKDGKVIIKNAPAIRMITKVISAPETPAHPVAKHKKHISIQYFNDTTKGAADTIIKHKKYKIVVEDENGMTTEYNSVNDLSAGDKKALFMKDDASRIIADTVITKADKDVYASAKWKKQLADIQKSTKDLGKYYKSKAWKKKLAEFQGSVDNMDNMFNYFDSEEYKQLVAENSEESAKKFLNSKEWKQQLKDLKNITSDASLYLRSPEYQKQLEELKKQGADMDKITAIAKYYGSGEGKKTWAKWEKELNKATAEIVNDSKKQFQDTKNQSEAKQEEAKASEDEKKAVKDMAKKLSEQERARADSAANVHKQ